MAVFKATIPVTFNFTVDASTEEEALTKAKELLENSRFYHEGDEFRFGQIWFHDVDDIEVFEDED
jgi:hypothetical protein